MKMPSPGLRKSAFLACFLAVSVSANSEKEPLRLDEVLRSVDTHYPLVVGALRELDKARGDHLSARGGFDPVLKSTYRSIPTGEYENRYFDATIEQPTPLWGSRLFAGYRRGDGNFGPYDEKLLTNEDGEVRAGLEVPVLRGGLTDERRARIGIAEKGLAASEATLGSQRLESRRVATYRYFEWVAAGEKLKIARALLQLAVERDEAMGHRVKKGDAARIDQVDNRRSVVQREAATVSALRSLEKSTLELSLFYRNAAGDPLLPSAERLPKDGLPLPALDAEKAPNVDLGKVLAAHPSAQGLRAQIDQNLIDRKLARNTLLPSLNAQLVASRDRGPGSPRKAITEYQAGLYFEFPLLLRAASGRLDSATAQGLKLDAQLALAQDRIRVALEDSLQALEAARRRIVASREEVELSEQVERAERVRFKHGDSNILTVNLREQATADARIRAIEALADYHRASADFEAAHAGTAAPRESASP